MRLKLKTDLNEDEVDYINQALEDTHTETDNNNSQLEVSEYPYEIVNQIYEDEEKKGVNDNTMPKQINYNSYKIPATEGGIYYKPEEGDNRIRLVTKPHEIKYWEEGKGSDYKTHRIEEGDEVPKGKDVRIKYAYLILDREDDNKVKVYEAPITVFRYIMEYANDKEYGDPAMYDITIKKTGTGFNTKYSVIASPKKGDITNEEAKSVKEYKSLDEIYSEEEEKKSK